jgi:mannose-6-phosphate isomerase-like protein (cupin superfamily)
VFRDLGGGRGSAMSRHAAAGASATLRAVLKRPDQKSEFFTEERCHILEVSNSPDDPDASVARARVDPGVTTVWHRVRDTVERYVILAGVGRVEVGDSLVERVKAGDVVVIPANERQRITNTGDTMLVFLCVCTPRFSWSNYQRLE